MIEEENNRLFFLVGVGYVCDVKSYNARRSVNENLPVRVTIKETGQTMTISCEDIKTKYVKVSNKEFDSKFVKDQKYKLVSYKWMPDKTNK